MVEERNLNRRTLSLLAAATSAIALYGHQARADVSESWIASSSGNWTTAANWSPSTNYPNNGLPAGTNYQATVSLPGSAAYTVTVNSNIAVDSVAIGSANATIDDTVGTLAVGGLSISSGVFELAGGTLFGASTGATVTLNSPSEFDLVSGKLNDLTFTGSDLDFSQPGIVHVTNGLNLSGNALNLTSSSATVFFDGSSQTIDNLSINATASNPAILTVGGTGLPAMTLTLGANADVHGNLSLDQNNGNVANTLLNNGTLNADINSKTLAIFPANFTNNAIAEASNGGILFIHAANWTNAATGTISANASTLTFGGSWSNAGTISAINASTVNLGGSFTIAGIGSINASADSAINITGTLDNTGNTLTLSGVSPRWTLNGGTITGGSVAFGDNLNINNGTFSGVTVPSGDSFGLTPGGTLALNGLWSNQGSISAGANSVLLLGGTFTPAVIGTINADPSAAVYITGALNNTGVNLTLANVGVPVSLNSGGSIVGGTLATGVNLQSINGTITSATIAPGTTIGVLANGSLTLGGSWSNQGAISLATNSTLNLGGNFTLASIGAINAASTGIVNISGSLDNTGSTLTLSSVTGSWNLNGGTITGGTVAVGSNLNIVSGTLNGATIQSGSFVNVNSGNTLSLSGSWNNAGTINTAGSATLNLGGNFTTPDLGTLNLSAKTTVNITGSLNNSNNTFTLNGLAGNWNVNGGTITGGTIDLSQGPALNVVNGTFNGVQLAGGDLNLNTFVGALTVFGGITGDGHNINLNAQGSAVIFGGASQIIDNINLNGTTNNFTEMVLGNGSGGPMTLTIGSHATLEGTLNINNFGGNLPTVGTVVNNGTINPTAVMFSNSNLVNNGTIEAPSNTLANIEPQALTFTNNGVMSATGGTISVSAQTWINAAGGTITANGGSLTLEEHWTNAARATISATNAGLDLEGSWVNQGSITAINSTVDLGGTVTPSAMGNLSIVNSTVNVVGTLNLSGGTLTLPATTGQWNLDDATIENGTLALHGQAFHVVGPFTSTLNSVRISGADLYLDGEGLVDVIGGLTVDTHNVNINAGFAEMGFDGSNMFIDNLNFNIPTSTSFTLYAGGVNTTTGAVLTLGQHVNANGWSSFAGVANAMIVNDGTINETSQTLGLDDAKFVNNGTINITNGTTLFISTNTQFTNNGIIDFIRTPLDGTPRVTAANGLNIGNGTMMGSAVISGDLNLGPASSVILGIGTLIQSSINDSIGVDGNINLGGYLLIDFTNGFQSSINSSDSFTLMQNQDGQNMSGAFQNVASGGRVETADGLGSFLVTYGPVPTFGHFIDEVVVSDFETTAEPWTNATGNSTWDTGASANFSVSSSPSVFHAGDVVTFNDSNNNGYNVTLNTTVTPGSVVFNNSAGDYNISGTGAIAGFGALFKFGSRTLTLNTINSYTGGTTVNAGTLVVGVNGALPTNGAISIGAAGKLQLGVSTGLATLSSLSISAGGILDVTNNHIILSYGAIDPASTIHALLQSGYNGGLWNGPGIDSSTAALPANSNFGIGYADGADGIVSGLSSGQIEIKYTLYGDANLDGVVNGDDFTILVGNLGKAVSGWDRGDFNYDGVVNGSDFTEFVGDLGKEANGADEVLPANEYAAIDAFAAANGLMQNIPEPTTGSLLLIGAADILRNRRRKQSA
jgi:fibronectin-binding autotransporter adhesin